jgi:hypothetical protein
MSNKFVVGIVAVLLLWGAPAILGGTAIEEGTAIATSDNLTVGTGYQSLSNDHIRDVDVVANGTTLGPEDYRVNSSDGTIRFVTCSEQSSGSDCPESGDNAIVDYDYKEVDERVETQNRYLGTLLGEFGNIGLLLVVIAGLVAVLRGAT